MISPALSSKNRRGGIATLSHQFASTSEFCTSCSLLSAKLLARLRSASCSRLPLYMITMPVRSTIDRKLGCNQVYEESIHIRTADVIYLCIYIYIFPRCKFQKHNILLSNQASGIHPSLLSSNPSKTPPSSRATKDTSNPLRLLVSVAPFTAREAQ